MKEKRRSWIKTLIANWSSRLWKNEVKILNLPWFKGQISIFFLQSRAQLNSKDKEWSTKNQALILPFSCRNLARNKKVTLFLLIFSRYTFHNPFLFSKRWILRKVTSQFVDQFSKQSSFFVRNIKRHFIVSFAYKFKKSFWKGIKETCKY